MSDSILPGYRFNTVSHRYISQKTGRFVARRDIVGLLDRQIMNSQERIADITRALHEGGISPLVWTTQMREELKQLHLQNMALGMGGWDRATQQSYGRVGGRLRGDYRRIEQLAKDIQDGKATLPQALNRARGYVGNARIQYYDAIKDRAGGSGQEMRTIMRRILGSSEHCPDCLNFYEQGWQPELPSPGTESVCGTYCQCDLLIKEVPIAEYEQMIGTRK